jgi:hypothetical protein
MATMEIYPDEVKANVLIKYFKLNPVYQCKLFKNKRPPTYPTNLDLLNLLKSIKDSKTLYLVFKYFDFLVNECTLNEKVILLEALDDNEKKEFIWRFKILQEVTWKQVMNREININLLVRILVSFTDAKACGDIFKEYLEYHLETTYGDFNILECLIDILNDNPTFNVFEHVECSKVLGKMIKEFNYFTGYYKIDPFLANMCKNLRYKVFKVLSNEYSNFRFSEMVSIMKIIHPNELDLFFDHCATLSINSYPDKYDKAKIKFSHNKTYSKITGKKNNTVLVYNDEHACIEYLNKIITKSNNIPCISSATCNNYIFKKEQVFDALKNLIKMLHKLHYDKGNEPNFNIIQVVSDVIAGTSMNKIIVVSKLLEEFEIKLDAFNNIYSSLKKFIQGTDIESYDAVLYKLIDNVIKRNCKSIFSTNMRRLIEAIDCNHYKILLLAILNNQNNNTLLVFNGNHDNNCYNIQVISEMICARLFEKKTLLSSEHYNCIVGCLKDLFWNYLNVQKSNYLPQFETMLLNLLDNNTYKVGFAVEFLNNERIESMDLKHKESLNYIVASNVAFLDSENLTSDDKCEIIGIDIKNVVTKDNIDNLLKKMPPNKRLLIIEYLIQNEMSKGNDCSNYIFSKLARFLESFINDKLSLIKMLSRYIDIPKKLSIIKAYSELFGSEYDSVIDYVSGL